jgi:hypothetical protein
VLSVSSVVNLCFCRPQPHPSTFQLFTSNSFLIPSLACEPT